MSASLLLGWQILAWACPLGLHFCSRLSTLSWTSHGIGIALTISANPNVSEFCACVIDGCARNFPPLVAIYKGPNVLCCLLTMFATVSKSLIRLSVWKVEVLMPTSRSHWHSNLELASFSSTRNLQRSSHAPGNKLGSSNQGKGNKIQQKTECTTAVSKVTSRLATPKALKGKVSRPPKQRLSDSTTIHNDIPHVTVESPIDKAVKRKISRVNSLSKHRLPGLKAIGETASTELSTDKTVKSKSSRRERPTGLQQGVKVDSEDVSESTPTLSKGKAVKGKNSKRQQRRFLKAISENIEAPSEADRNEKKKVVIVESPAKAKTIEAYLGPEYLVLPTYGHIRVLAARAGSVRLDDDCTMLWEVPSDARVHLNKIKAAVENAKCLVLATDPDREGEAIAWHVVEMMISECHIKKSRIKVFRVSFTEITKLAIMQAIEAPRDISMPLVNACLARRALDYLIGFGLSPLLWRKLPGSKSAGRVQSAALTLICDREREIEEFMPREYWTLEAECCLAIEESNAMPFLAKSPEAFPVQLTHVDGKKLHQFSLVTEVEGRDLAGLIMSSEFRVQSTKESVKRRSPAKPYITSTLQHDAQNKLGFATVHTMNLAQRLYEGVKLGNDDLSGLITYMRTDSHQLSNEAILDIRSFAAERYGEEYVPIQSREFKTTVKIAQEAHEAIRPTDIRRLPSMLTDVLEKDALRLYSLIWARTVSCQMEQSISNEITVVFTEKERELLLRGHSSSLSFPGFVAALQDKEAHIVCFEEEMVDNDAEKVKVKEALSLLKKGDLVTVRKSEARQHFTSPPPRYTEGSLVIKMEELGIGRPSTYASTLKTLQLRNYVRLDRHRIFPEVRGRMVSAFLSHFFPKFMDYDFTARLEQQLDEVAAGLIDWKDSIKGFWPGFQEDINNAMSVPILKVIDLMQEIFVKQFFKGLGVNGKVCPSCGMGKLTLKLSRYGSGYFFGCDSYPICQFKTTVIKEEESESLDHDPEEVEVIRSVVTKSTREVGLDPVTGCQILVKSGPFGHYIQIGGEQSTHARRCVRVPNEMNPQELTLDNALEILKYPMKLGQHPKDGDPIWIGMGKSSYYLRHRGGIVSFPKDMQPEEMTVEKAVELFNGDSVRWCGRRSNLRADEHGTKNKGSKRKEANASCVRKKTSSQTQKKVPAAQQKKTSSSRVKGKKDSCQFDNAEKSSLYTNNTEGETKENEKPLKLDRKDGQGSMAAEIIEESSIQHEELESVG